MISMLKVSGLTMQFGGLVAVDNVDLEVRKGEIVSIIGPNGAGKTTVFNMLTGVYTPTSGEIRFEDTSIVGKNPQDIVKAGIARTFQNLRLFKQMRVIENVLVGVHIHVKYRFIDMMFRTPRFRRGEQEAAQRAVDILESIDLAGHLHDYASSLPYGEQRKLEIARAIATGAKLLLLDEPAAGMNDAETQELLAFIEKLRASGLTILLIEHDMNLVMNISDRVYVLDHGKLISKGRPEEVAKDPVVIEAYLGRSEDDAEN